MRTNTEYPARRGGLGRPWFRLDSEPMERPHPPIDDAAMKARLAERYARIAERNEATEEEAGRARFRILLGAGLACAMWCVVGLLGIGMGLASRTVETGNIWFWGGLVVGNGGILATLIWTVEKLRSIGDNV